jgi:RNA polymerase sigma factor (sigma-70 family)
VEPWIAPLSANQPEEAWDVLIGRYRRLIFGAIRRYTTDADDVMDVFARVCEALRENDFARLRKYAAQANAERKFSTWLCAVVYNLAIDWIRSRDGRPRLSAATDLRAGLHGAAQPRRGL